MVPNNTEAGKYVASLGRKLHQKLRVKHGLGAEFNMPHRPLLALLILLHPPSPKSLR